MYYFIYFSKEYHLINIILFFSFILAVQNEDKSQISIHAYNGFWSYSVTLLQIYPHPPLPFPHQWYSPFYFHVLFDPWVPHMRRNVMLVFVKLANFTCIKVSIFIHFLENAIIFFFTTADPFCVQKETCIGISTVTWLGCFGVYT